MIHNIKCKFCKCEVAALADPECPPEIVLSLLPMVCCNRCGDYREWMRKMTYRIKKACWDWAVLPEKKRQDKQQETFTILEDLTKKTHAVICRFHHVHQGWDRDWVDQLMERPDKAEAIVRSADRAAWRIGNGGG